MNKKLAAIALAALMALAAIGCGSSDTKETETQKETVKETTAEETVEENNDESEAEDESKEINYSMGLLDSGYVDIKASDFFEVPDLSTIVLKKDDIVPGEDRIQSIVDQLLSAYPKKTTDREVVDGDTVNIDYVGSVDGVEFAGGNTQGNGTDVTIGVTSYIDDFLEQLIGHKPGETFDVNVTFPESYPQSPDLQGKDAVFVTTINYISEKTVLDEEFMKEHGSEVEETFGQLGLETVDQVLTYIEETLYDYNFELAIEQYMTDAAKDVKVPDEIYKVAENLFTIQMESYYQMSLEDLEYMYGFSEDDMKEQITNSAKYMVYVQAAAEANGIEVTDELLEEKIGESYLDEIEKYGRGYLAQFVIGQEVEALIKESCTLE